MNMTFRSIVIQVKRDPVFRTMVVERRLASALPSEK